MPTILIIAGPNGAGKTTFVNEWLKVSGWDELPFLNADEISRESEMAGLAPNERDVRAGRELLQRLEAHVAGRVSFILETTLSSRAYARRIPQWRASGYHVELVFVRLPSVEASIERVAKRVRNGGHPIAEADLRRRFDRSLTNLEEVYKPVVDAWEIWESGPSGRMLISRSQP